MQALEVFYRIPFAVLEVPNIRLKKPGFVKVPSAMVVFSFILFSYFLVTGGIIYDVIVEPPSIGSVNGQSMKLKNLWPRNFFPVEYKN